jgi:hypothetical protein
MTHFTDLAHVVKGYAFFHQATHEANFSVPAFYIILGDRKLNLSISLSINPTPSIIHADVSNPDFLHVKVVQSERMNLGNPSGNTYRKILDRHFKQFLVT